MQQLHLQLLRAGLALDNGQLPDHGLKTLVKAVVLSERELSDLLRDIDVLDVLDAKSHSLCRSCTLEPRMVFQGQRRRAERTPGCEFATFLRGRCVGLLRLSLPVEIFGMDTPGQVSDEGFKNIDPNKHQHDDNR